MEAKAIESIISVYEKNELEIYTSEAVNFEISNITDVAKRRQIEDLYNMLSLKNIQFDDNIKKRAIQLRAYNIKDMDAIHVSFAESADIDYFITTDKFLLYVSKRISLKIKVINPIEFIMEV